MFLFNPTLHGTLNFSWTEGISYQRNRNTDFRDLLFRTEQHEAAHG